MKRQYLLTEREWNPFKNGLLKVFAYRKDGHACFLFAAHHLLGDGKGILELTGEFAQCYVQEIKPAYVEETLIGGIDDLPPKSELGGISRLLVKQAGKQWKKEQRRLDYKTYAVLAEEYMKTHPVTYTQHPVTEENYANMQKMCRENGITFNDLLMAYMYLETGIDKIIIAFDIREKLTCYKKGACGNYASAAGVVTVNEEVRLCSSEY